MMVSRDVEAKAGFLHLLGQHAGVQFTNSVSRQVHFF